MIRDITLGQYYPADSVLHRMNPRAKLVGTMVFIISVFVFHTFPGYAVATLFLAGMIIHFQSSAEIYVQGTQSNRHAAADHSRIQYSSDAWKSPLAVGNPSCNRGRSEAGRKNGNPLDLSGHRFFNHDPDNHTKPAYRRSGTPSQTTE